MRWLSSSLGKKYVMGVTGLLMLGFVMAHMLGNLSTFGGANGLNAYAEHLRAFPPMLWAFRGVMVLAIMLHVLFGITLYLQNKAARPVDYAIKKDQRTSFSAQTMIWTGLLLGTFVVLHLLHFTLHLGNPQWNEMLDAAGRFDVFKMVSSSLSNAGIAIFYMASVVVLLLHLLHGVQSFFQSLGLTNENTFCTINAGGKLVAFVAALGFILIPLSILFGIVK